MIIDELVTRVAMDDAYTTKAVRAAGAATALGAAIDNVGDQATQSARALGVSALQTNVSTLAFQALTTSTTAATIAQSAWNATITVGVGILAGLTVAVGAAVAAVGIYVALLATVGLGALRAAADFDALEMSLRAVEGSADRAAGRMAELREMAKKPGIGFQEAIQGYVQLRRSDIEPEFAKRILAALANQIALSGGGREEFGRVARATMQVAVAPFLQGDELRQFSEAGIPAYGIVKQAFGTADTEELKKMGITSRQVLEELVLAMEAMPQVGNSAKNTIENLQMSLELLHVEGGKVISEMILPFAENLTATFEKLSGSGVVGQVVASFADSLDRLGFDLSNTDDLVLDLAAAAMTAADGMGVLVEMLGKLWEVIEPFLGLIPRAVVDWVRSQFDANRTVLDMQMQLAEKIKPVYPNLDGLQGEPPPEVKEQTTYLREVARNTREALDIQRQMLGGGGFADINAVEMSRLRRRGGTTGDPIQEVLNAMRHFMMSVAVEVQTSGARDRRRLGVP